MYIVVGGLGTNREYYAPLKAHLGQQLTIFELKKDANHVKSLAGYLNVQRRPYVLIAFSLGCVLVMKSLPSLRTRPVKIFFVNPSNIVIDTCVNRRPLEWMWRVPWVLRRAMVHIYETRTSKQLEEPPDLMRRLLSKPYDHWNDIVHRVNKDFNWLHATRRIQKDHYRIVILSGKDDRYHKFARVLNDLYPDTFTLKTVPGQHHIIHNNHHYLSHSMYDERQPYVGRSSASTRYI